MEPIDLTMPTTPPAGCAPQDTVAPSPRTLTSPCATCPFTRGENVVKMTLPQALDSLEGSVFGPPGPSGFLCHCTTTIAPDGTPTNVAHASPCVGAQLFAEHCAQTNPALCALAGGAARPDTSHLRGGDRVYSSLEEFLAATLPDGAPRRHNGYIRHTPDGPWELLT